MTEYIMQPFDKRQWAYENILTTPEAIEYLGISRARMSHMIKNGKIVPLKKQGYAPDLPYTLYISDLIRTIFVSTLTCYKQCLYLLH